MKIIMEEPMAFKEGDTIRNIHTGTENVVTKTETIFDCGRTKTVYEKDNGDRFNSDYERDYEKVYT